MKKHKLTLTHFIALAVLTAAGITATGADTKDRMIGKITGRDQAPSAPPYAVAAHALVGRDNSIAVSAWSGALVFEGATYDAHKTTLVVADPTGARSVTFADASGTVELIKVVAKTATGTLTADECRGGVITNTGAGGAIVLTLPAPVPGMRLRVCLTVAQDVDLNAANGTRILALTNADGDAISSAAAVGNSLELVAVSTTQWAAFAVSGTWTDVN